MASMDEERRKGLKPVVTLSRALGLLQDHWKFAEDSFKTIRILDSYDDCNFFIEADNTKYLLKCYNGVESDNIPILDAQTAMMNVLTQHGIVTSRTIPSMSNGKEIVKVELPVSNKSTYTCAVRLCHWVDGNTLVDRATPSNLQLAGRLLGRIQNTFTAQGFDHEGLHRYHQWDQRNTADLKPFTRYIPSDTRRALVEGIIKRFEAEVLPVQDALRRGPLQADFNDANIVLIPPVGEGREPSVGVIDFGDIVHGWVVSDVAIAAAYATVSSYGKEHPYAAAAAMLHGVSQEFALTELERRLLPLFATCRLATSASLGAYSYHQQPENEYLLLHAEPAWTSLEALTDVRVKTGLAELFSKACTKGTSLDELVALGTVLEDARAA
eukprot:m.191785 g.191785  ORF g.191785 m.191785 type:complete len:383 (+) comp18600_c0_seq4:375-1523(+)